MDASAFAAACAAGFPFASAAADAAAFTFASAVEDESAFAVADALVDAVAIAAAADAESAFAVPTAEASPSCPTSCHPALPPELPTAADAFAAVVTSADAVVDAVGLAADCAAACAFAVAAADAASLAFESAAPCAAGFPIAFAAADAAAFTFASASTGAVTVVETMLRLFAGVGSLSTAATVALFARTVPSASGAVPASWIGNVLPAWKASRDLGVRVAAGQLRDQRMRRVANRPTCRLPRTGQVMTDKAAMRVRRHNDRIGHLRRDRVLHDEPVRGRRIGRIRDRNRPIHRAPRTHDRRSRLHNRQIRRRQLHPDRRAVIDVSSPGPRSAILPSSRQLPDAASN